jgi:signal transduction histidine kinase
MSGTKLAVETYPPGRLLFYPAIPNGEEPPDSTFAAGEALEFQRNDPAGAAKVFRALSRSPDTGLRAGALLRLGRNLRKTGQYDEALRTYDELARLGTTSVLGLPAELVAREARGTVLEANGKREELQAEARLMHSALWSGRWHLLRPAWEFHEEEARRWSGSGPLAEMDQNILTLTVAAAMTFDKWAAQPESKGRRILKVEGRPVLVSWTGSSDRITAALAGPAFLVSKWEEALQGRGVQGALLDIDGMVLLGAYTKGGRQAVRTAAATGLPGTLYTTFAGPDAGDAGWAGRRRLLLAGFAVLILTLLAGSYFIIRSINRERAVARLQSEFVSAVSHEFRTPLTSLRQLAEMLSKGRVPTEELRQQSYDVLDRESERLQRLVESLLDFGRIEAHGFRYRYESLDPVTFVRDLAAEFQEQVGPRGYCVELALGGEYPSIRADREALGLALTNLLDNAVKYSPDCRTIWVEMARERGRLAIRVRDRGLGIPASEKKEIFKKFVRGTGSGKASIQGTGVGLAMARRVIEAHGGEIRVESELGRGSTFTIMLPLEKII